MISAMSRRMSYSREVVVLGIEPLTAINERGSVVLMCGCSRHVSSSHRFRFTRPWTALEFFPEG